MKRWFQSFVVAFSMYSALPMPRVEWNKENMRYALCFFPLIGVVTGLLMEGWGLLCGWAGLGRVLFAAVACVLPVAVSGGIHLDGFCDTCDALGSHQSREKKLEILKDPHTGAFALIGCVLYFLLSFGLWSELKPDVRALGVVGLGFVLSRVLSGLSVVTFPCVSTGLLAAFSTAAQKKRVAAVEILLGLLCAAGMVCLRPAVGSLAVLAAGVTFAYYFRMSRRQFGGITGDLAGYFLQLCEIAMLLAVAAGQKIF
ncbi:adenosylcobinamide-GDP ribazoletransferase [Zongyangia hominis]|uniref:Adenosylcobinamide-GDP ribazoletransferase n=1 Tax=Zongyangia hominis TaxID=2763677 RepID=A0A926EBH1_9FIRM|nr:adenosylcobinamide-GDP ribazoletransferase [Zongyangia hominis]MBC8569299.1 adenosylcobinamide-GDP ribazoletransferase [Zongyangia hominis]